MAQTAITFRVDQNLKNNFDALCDDFGLSITSAFTIFMKAVVRERKIPFEIQSKNMDQIREKGMRALEEMRQLVADSDQPEMSLNEINDFIKQVRDEVSK